MQRDEQLRRLREERTCRVCLDRTVGVVLVPCGHLACAECAPNLQQCPICGLPPAAGQGAPSCPRPGERAAPVVLTLGRLLGWGQEAAPLSPSLAFPDSWQISQVNLMPFSLMLRRLRFGVLRRHHPGEPQPLCLGPLCLGFPSGQGDKASCPAGHTGWQPSHGVTTLEAREKSRMPLSGGRAGVFLSTRPRWGSLSWEPRPDGNAQGG